MRFLADMGVSTRIADWLRDEGYDTVHVREIGMERAEDASIFALARAENRVIVTFDLDFGEIASHALEGSPGLVVFRLRNTRVSHVLDRLQASLPRVRAALDERCIVVIEDSRYRVRTLPHR